MLMTAATPPDTGAPFTVPPHRRSWLTKFDDAFRGLKLGVRGHSSFFVHFFMATVVIAAAATLRVGLVQWCILLGCLTAVIAAELFNSTIEILCRVIEIERLPNGKAPLDIAAGAVLAVSIGASIIGAIVFIARLIELFG
jgi:diacylglycerol kinase